MSCVSRSVSRSSAARHLSSVARSPRERGQGLDEEADARERRAKLVAHLRHEVGLELAQVRLAPQEDEDEHDARDGDEDEADGEDAEEDVEDLRRGT